MGSRGEVNMSDFPTIKSTHSLVAKYVTKPIWDKLSSVKTATSGFTLAQAIACAVEFDNQHCGIYAGDWDSYKDFADVFDPLIQEYHGISADATHTSDMEVGKIQGNVDPAAPVHSCRIRVGRSIDGFGLSPGITKEQRVGVENLMKKAFANLKGDLAGTYYPHWHGRESEAAAGRRPLPLCLWRPQLEDRRHGARLARGSRHLPQQGQDLPHLGQRGGSTPYHLHADGRRCQGCL